MDRSILNHTEATLIAPSWDRDGQNIVQPLFSLACGLLVRLNDFDQSSDAQYCAAYFRYLRSQPLEAFGVPCDVFKPAFLYSLTSQLERGVGDVSQNIDEMTVHSREFLDPNIPQPLLERAVRALISAYHSHRELSLSLEDLEKGIKCLQEVNRRLESHEFTAQLALLFCFRFDNSCSLDDYKEAITLFDKIASESNGDSPGNYFEDAAFNSAGLACDRADIYGNPEYIEEAIYRCQTYLRIPHVDDLRRGAIAGNLAGFMERRSISFGIMEGLQEARSHKAEGTYVPVPSFSRLTTSLLDKSTTGFTHWWAEPREFQEHILALGDVHRTTDIAEIEEGIKYCRLLLASCPPNDPLTFSPTDALGKALFHAFKHTDKMEYLDESIAVFRRILEMSIARWRHFGVINSLLEALAIRCALSRNKDDFDEAMQLVSVGCNDTYANVRNRFRLSREWADNARLYGHQTTSTAYETAISLMQDTLLFAPTLETQHFNLVALRNAYEELPLDIASYEAGRGRLKEAIQVLERGRALIWSELRGLRTSIHQLEVDPHLAEEFTVVNRELEALTTSTSPGTVTKGNDRLEAETVTGMDKFGCVVVQHRELLERRKKLVSKIRTLPGLEGFSEIPTFDTLRSAAAHGPVVIINHSKWRSDILIVLHNAHPSLITTTDDFYNHAIELRNRLLRTRKQYPLESRQYQRALRSVLKGLYELIGRPVIKELRRLKIREQSRIWWCPTSVFCSLPLHAMGPIPSDDGVPCFFSDLYIPSYTPTLSALIESRKPSKVLSEKPSVLLVANPDGAMKQAWPEIRFIQGLDTKVTTLLEEVAKPEAVLEGLQDHRFAHFVCHGNLVPEKPFDASFRLHEGNRLTLLDLVRSRLPTAEFAFLSACHTAELTEGSIADEGLHLTAAVQYCGFRSVVGTMWAMADEDGGDLTKLFYTSMFSGGGPEVPYHERSARALRDAVRSLRKKKSLPLEQWVNFVHFGA